MSEIFDANFFEKLNHLQLASHIRVDQGMSGHRKSSAKGSSVEFSDFREYLPGDDIRRIDWNAYGRLDRLYIKQFMEEKEVFYHIFLDASGSMRYGEQKKSVMAQRLAAVLAWMVLAQLDRVEVLSLREGRLDPTGPVVGRGRFRHLLSELEALSFEGAAQLYEGVRRARLSGRGVCILLSDFLEASGLEEMIRYLTYKRQEVCLVQILAREELCFNGEGDWELTDLESRQAVRVTLSRSSIRLYEETLRRHNHRLQELAKRYGAAFLQVCSDEPLEQVVFQSMKRFYL